MEFLGAVGDLRAAMLWRSQRGGLDPNPARLLGSRLHPEEPGLVHEGVRQSGQAHTPRSAIECGAVNPLLQQLGLTFWGADGACDVPQGPIHQVRLPAVHGGLWQR